MSNSFPRSAWECRLRRSASASGTSPPVGGHMNQCLDSRIIPGTGIPPVCWIADVPSLDRVLVDVFEFLPTSSVSMTFGWLPSCHNWNARSPLCRALWYSGSEETATHRTGTDFAPSPEPRAGGRRRASQTAFSRRAWERANAGERGRNWPELAADLRRGPGLQVVHVQVGGAGRRIIPEILARLLNKNRTKRDVCDKSSTAEEGQNVSRPTVRPVGPSSPSSKTSNRACCPFPGIGRRRRTNRR